jgi:hypothetical protein
MSSSVTIAQSDYNNLIQRLNRMESLLHVLISGSDEPPYGTEQWWTWAHSKGLEAKKNGKYTRLQSDTDIDEFFDSLSS